MSCARSEKTSFNIALSYWTLCELLIRHLQKLLPQIQAPLSLYMPRIVLDPAILPLQYPRASTAKVQKVRIVAQVSEHIPPFLFLVRVPNLPELHTQVVIDGAAAEPEPVPMNIENLHVACDCLRKGTIVSVWGTYDGESVTAWECKPANGQELLDGGSEILAEASNLVDL